ncbi:tegument protein [Glossina pallidipes salivary gland hypertrophy virus]|uniref:Tegument protein n=1 Tax=Glossina hytrovirus (isolate Glossina pallidipes/Ethiopia/Seibersdorf/-) TaxID=379529 RepID=A0A0Y0JE18_GHVS|nr:tegument protein [Glossina pallidipes salivary gland hypertrophy virus]
MSFYNYNIIPSHFDNLSYEDFLNLINLLKLKSSRKDYVTARIIIKEKYPAFVNYDSLLDVNISNFIIYNVSRTTSSFTNNSVARAKLMVMLYTYSERMNTAYMSYIAQPICRIVPYRDFIAYKYYVFDNYSPKSMNTFNLKNPIYNNYSIPFVVFDDYKYKYDMKCFQKLDHLTNNILTKQQREYVYERYNLRSFLEKISFQCMYGSSSIEFERNNTFLDNILIKENYLLKGKSKVDIEMLKANYILPLVNDKEVRNNFISQMDFFIVPMLNS